MAKSGKPPGAETPVPQVRKPGSRSKSRPAEHATPPAITHGTRVRFNIVCGRCGAEDTLPFVPKTQGEILCRRCAEKVFGPDWAHGRRVEAGEQFPFTCAKCGREDLVPFKPKKGRELLCRACLRGEERPSTARLRGMKRVD